MERIYLQLAPTTTATTTPSERKRCWWRRRQQHNIQRDNAEITKSQNKDLTGLLLHPDRWMTFKHSDVSKTPEWWKQWDETSAGLHGDTPWLLKWSNRAGRLGLRRNTNTAFERKMFKCRVEFLPYQRRHDMRFGADSETKSSYSVFAISYYDILALIVAAFPKVFQAKRDFMQRFRWTHFNSIIWLMWEFVCDLFDLSTHFFFPGGLSLNLSKGSLRERNVPLVGKTVKLDTSPNDLRSVWAGVKAVDRSLVRTKQPHWDSVCVH